MNDNYHKVAKEFSTPIEKLKIGVIGAGGTGSYVLQGLAKINLALPSLVHGSKGFHVDVWDPDVISKSNVVRQLYREENIGDKKAEILVRSINRYYGYEWHPYSVKFEKHSNYNLIIICVDSMAARREIYKSLKSEYSRYSNFYIVDFGNGKDFGQVLLNHYIANPKRSGFKNEWEFPKGYLETEDDENEPSCSIAQALEKQKMFINPTIANLGLDLIFDLLTKPIITKKGLYLDMNSGKMAVSTF